MVMNDDPEPLSYKRVRRRLTMVIEVMPIRRDVIYSDQLLKNIETDLREILRALDYLNDFHS